MENEILIDYESIVVNYRRRIKKLALISFAMTLVIVSLLFVQERRRIANYEKQIKEIEVNEDGLSVDLREQYKKELLKRESYGRVVEEDGNLYYYENGKLEGKGLIFMEDRFLYVKANGQLARSEKYMVTRDNGLLLPREYEFDDRGRIINFSASEDSLIVKNAVEQQDELVEPTRTSMSRRAVTGFALFIFVYILISVLSIVKEVFSPNIRSAKEASQVLDIPVLITPVNRNGVEKSIDSIIDELELKLDDYDLNNDILIYSSENSEIGNKLSNMLNNKNIIRTNNKQNDLLQLKDINQAEDAIIVIDNKNNNRRELIDFVKSLKNASVRVIGVILA